MKSESFTLRRALEYLCAGLLVVIILIVFANVVGRYFFSRPLRWSDEVAQFLFLWFSYLGALAAVIAGRQYSVSNLIDLLKPPLRRAVKTASDLIVVGMLLVLVWAGAKIVELLRFQVSPALDIPIYYVYSALPLTSLLMTIAILMQIINRLRGGPEPGQEVPLPENDRSLDPT